MHNQLSVQINSLVSSTAEVRWRPGAAVELCHLVDVALLISLCQHTATNLSNSAPMYQFTMKKITISLCLLVLAGCASKIPRESEYNLGVQAYRLKDYASARQHWAKAMDEHEITAYNNLGYLLYNGLGGEVDMNQAVSLWTQAAESGERESQWHLGQAFEDGKGREQNFTEAYAWYRCAAASFQAEPAVDHLDEEIARDASQSLSRLLPKLSPGEFEDAEKLAKLYISKYSKATGN